MSADRHPVDPETFGARPAAVGPTHFDRPILDEVRERCAEVVEASPTMSVDAAAIERLANRLESTAIPSDSGTDLAHVPFGDAESTAAWVLSLDAINFGSGWFPHLDRPADCSGYELVSRSWRSYLEATGPFTVERGARFCDGDCSQIFGQPIGEGRVGQLMALFAAAFRELSELVATDFGGSFLGLVESADGSSDALVNTLRRASMFDDVAQHRSGPVPILKRAQIAVIDLHRAFIARGAGSPVDDPQRLTAFADNLVPHVLRRTGCLVVDPAVVTEIEGSPLLAAGSTTEIELRAASIVGVELLTGVIDSRLRAAGSSTATVAADVDFRLWTLGSDVEFRDGGRHRTLTVAY